MHIKLRRRTTIDRDGQAHDGPHTHIRTRYHMPAWGPLVFFLIALVLLIGSAYSVYTTKKFISHAQEISGTIVKLHESHSTTKNSNGRTRHSTTYCPIYGYQYPPGGKYYEHQSNVCSSPAPTVGERVKLLIDPTKPEDVTPNDPFHLWLLPGVLGVLSLVLLTLAAIGKLTGPQDIRYEKIGDKEWTDTGDEARKAFKGKKIRWNFWIK